MLTPKLTAGQAAEQTASGYLHGQGLRSIVANYRCRWGEIDLICADGDAIVFVEVRYRNSTERMSPQETVASRKQQRLIRTASHYLQHNRSLAHRACRFDIVAISGDLQQPKIEWLKGAFQPN